MTMKINALKSYLLEKTGVTEDFPFETETLVFKENYY